MSTYRRDFDQIKCMLFLIKDEKCLEKCGQIWQTVSSIFKKKS